MKNNEKSTCNNQNIKKLNIWKKKQSFEKMKRCFFHKKSYFMEKKKFCFFFIYISITDWNSH